MHLYQVELVASGATFMVVAENEAEAARAAEQKWKNWAYLGDAKAISVTLAGWGGQYPPKNGSRSDIPWLILPEQGK